MSMIVPTILTNDKNLYMRQYEAYSKFAKRIQVDISDGIFSPTLTMDESNAWRQQGWAALDLHMMVMNPSQHLPTILKLKPSLVISMPRLMKTSCPSSPRSSKPASAAASPF